MSKLSEIEKMKLENMFSMSGGYVLGLNNRPFQALILKTINIDIDNARYERLGTSKANRLRVLWELEDDIKVGKLTEEMLLYLEAQLTIKNEKNAINQQLFDDCLRIAYKLQGKNFNQQATTANIDDFLKIEVDEISINLLKIDASVTPILEQRVVEVKKCLKSEASLSVIFLCGSILEGVLLGIATQNIKDFNQSTISPKDKVTGKVKQFQDWSLNNFIEVAYELKFLGLDVKKYSHSLRDFRNYIHPFAQMSSGFNPDNHTAKISWQVLKAALHDIHEKVK